MVKNGRAKAFQKLLWHVLVVVLHFVVGEIIATFHLALDFLMSRYIAPDTQVTTNTGTYVGFECFHVRHFRGIPYATTVGRFAAPRPVPPLASRTTTTVPVSARQYGPIAAQPFSVTQLRSPVPLWALWHLIRVKLLRRTLYGSTVCQNLNIVTPSGRESSTTLHPVMVFIHGGGFLWGTANEHVYNPEELARRHAAVVVTINYRLGVFGFLHIPGGIPANLGLQDQTEALRWVKANIHFFGGNPENITLFGHSAGAMSCATHMGNPVTLPEKLFAKVILQSGATQCVHSLADASDVAAGFAMSAGKEDLLTWLRTAPIEEIIQKQTEFALQTQIAYDHGISPFFLPFCPVVDGVILPQHPLLVSASHVPLLCGTTDHEWAFVYQVMAWLEGSTCPQSIPIQSRLSGWLGILPHDQKRINKAMATYTKETSSLVSRMPDPCVPNALLTDIFFRSPQLAHAKAHAERGGKVFVYRFFQPSIVPQLSAAHAIELPFLFGTTKLYKPLVGFTQSAQLCEKLTQQVWVDFAMFGSPALEAAPWDPTKGKRQTIALAGWSSGKVEYMMDPDSDELDVWEGFWMDIARR